jgi:hypothetical protein
VMHRGQIVADLQPATADIETVGRLMTTGSA